MSKSDWNRQLVGDIWLNDLLNPEEGIRKLLNIQHHQQIIDKQEQLLEHAVAMLARSAEIFDTDTGDHVKRISSYCTLFASLLGADKKYQKIIGIQAQLHDVGKIHVSSSILNKPGRLTDDEFEEIKQHTVNGGRIIGERNPDFALAHQIALYHHEKWDGSGYPYGLKEEEIPIAARMVSIVDVFDALITQRCYKPAYSYDHAYSIMTEGDESRRFDPHQSFDPNIVSVFWEHYDKFIKIHETNRKTEEALDSQNMDIIVLDDDPVIRRHLELMLGKAGSVNIYTFDNIESMQASLANSMLHPSLFFVDIQLPDGTGHDVAKDIRGQYPNAYLVCITALDNVSRDTLYLYDRILHKPIELANLMEITETVIRYNFKPLKAKEIQLVSQV